MSVHCTVACYECTVGFRCAAQLVAVQEHITKLVSLCSIADARNLCAVSYYMLYTALLMPGTCVLLATTCFIQHC